MDSESAHWIAALQDSGIGHDDAVGRLHEMLLRIARSELNRRRGSHGLAGPELDDLAYQAAADAVVSITAKLEDFRGESRFTTWAYKFAILEVSSKLGRHYWTRHPTTSLDAEDWERLPDRFGLRPEEYAGQRDLVCAIRDAVDGSLTVKQRAIFVALVVRGIPLDTLVAQTGSTRNAIYKMMFDARRKLRAALVAGGYLEEDG
ncbi:sigma-70 family RNA polymerase sigma factor [Flexivirga caeni]|uniref:Sigma-70 family RNA polymerase sigma factor n=1 Tax=Flexivirga caeni TaxID=2294115 RepID=A0A3M9MHQ6_9MICO|nr:sigma-70 family RNA polymerase sigma factor [Flexivirga caeni]RNI24715.1 sigma-70 family RNA polymerase sigma factor [Flexivirga caeni]